MPKLLQINPVLRRNTSTGKIMQEIGELAASRGWESWIAYSRGRDGVPDAPSAPKGSKLLPVGSRLSVALHGLETRLFDRHGLGSRLATRRFVKALRRLDPDIIHIHNIHGYFLNYKILFRYLAECGKPVIWTVHDCWLYTGHCYYYSAAGCDAWTRGCGNCPQRKAFPSSLFFDRSGKNFRDKSKAFNSVPKDKFVIAPVSEWIAGEMSRSFLKDSRFLVIHNGIDTEQFRPMDDAEIRERYGLGDRKVILALASIWLKEKGFDDLVRRSSMLRPDELLVMVGKMTPEQKAALPESVLRIDRTDNVQQLAALYST
ncbi:MAG: glycosyltransferase, partial [Candidatus Cryptobacteroides sp.]|nr:glycosyltransferase [Candidatus Cryptobacteroides sp.]